MDQFEQNYEDEIFGPSPEEGINDEQLIDTDLAIDDENYDTSEQGVFEDDDSGMQGDVSDSPYIEQYLRAKGIDTDNIRIEDENGNLEAHSFKDLSDEEKLTVMQSSDDSPISDEEINTINYLRTNGINLEDYTNLVRQQAIQDYLAQSSQTVYDVDQFTDEELMAYDMIQRYGDTLSDEQIDATIEREKEDDAAFQAKVNKIRAEYHQMQDFKNQQIQQQQLAKQQQMDIDFQNALYAAASNTKELQGIELEDQDKQEVLNFMLARDAAGRTEFSKALSNPELMFKVGWYLLYGDMAHNATVDYFKHVIETSRRGGGIRQQPKTVNRTNKRNKSNDPFGLDDVFRN